MGRCCDNFIQHRNSLNFITGELKNPAKNLPLAIGVSLPLVAIIYVLTNAAYLFVLDRSVIESSPAVAIEFGKRVFGPTFYWFIPACVSISTFGALNSNIYTSSRVLLASANGPFVPTYFAHLDHRLHTPVRCICFQTLLTIAYLFSGNNQFMVYVDDRQLRIAD